MSTKPLFQFNMSCSSIRKYWTCDNLPGVVGTSMNVFLAFFSQRQRYSSVALAPTHLPPVQSLDSILTNPLAQVCEPRCHSWDHTSKSYAVLLSSQTQLLSHLVSISVRNRERPIQICLISPPSLLYLQTYRRYQISTNWGQVNSFVQRSIV